MGHETPAATRAVLRTDDGRNPQRGRFVPLAHRRRWAFARKGARVSRGHPRGRQGRGDRDAVPGRRPYQERRPAHAKVATYGNLMQKIGAGVHPGFKLFFDEDTRDGGRLMTAKEVLALSPQPEYVMYE